METTICDPCKKENKITETIKYMRVKGRPDLRLDVCPSHGEEVKKLSMIDYVRYCYSLLGINLKDTDEEIQMKFLRG